MPDEGKPLTIDMIGPMVTRMAPQEAAMSHRPLYHKDEGDFEGFAVDDPPFTFDEQMLRLKIDTKTMPYSVQDLGNGWHRIQRKDDTCLTQERR